MCGLNVGFSPYASPNVFYLARGVAMDAGGSTVAGEGFRITRQPFPGTMGVKWRFWLAAGLTLWPSTRGMHCQKLRFLGIGIHRSRGRGRSFPALAVE